MQCMMCTRFSFAWVLDLRSRGFTTVRVTYSSMGETKVWTLFVFDRSWQFWLCHFSCLFLFINFVIEGVYGVHSSSFDWFVYF